MACTEGKVRPKTKFVSASGASRQLGGKPSHVTVNRMARRGEIPGAVLIGKTTLIPQSWIDNILTGKPDFLS